MSNNPDPIRDRYIADLRQWLTPDLLYHCFTGENDSEELERIANLDHALQQTLLERVERLWPDRLAQIAANNRKEKQVSKKAVQQYILKLQP